MNENPQPPIAAPHGGERKWQPPLPGDKQWPMGMHYIAVYYSPWGWHLPRCWAKMLALQPLKSLVLLVLLTVLVFLLQSGRVPSVIAGSVLLVSLLRNLWKLASTDKELLVFDDRSLWQFRPKEVYPFVWRDQFRIVNWRGDVFFLFLWRIYFIPRETFASSAQAHELTSIARQLKGSKGAMWSSQWESRTLGNYPDDQVRLSAES